MPKPTILIQLDTDPHASVFDAVVAVDAGVERLLQYSSITPDEVRDLVHGAIFTRAPQDLANTAIFIGGSDVKAGEALLRSVRATFFGPLHVSVLFDANGANTTAAAAVLAASKHVQLNQCTATVLGGTGPVGQRAARLLCREGATVRVVSRSLAKAEETCRGIAGQVAGARLTPLACNQADEMAAALDSTHVVIAAGAAGVELLPAGIRRNCVSLQVAIDLNAVPPVGIGGVEPTDKAKDRESVICYGAIGVGGAKMKIHRAAIQRLFTASDLVLDAEEVYALGRDLT
jgi:hypothetical protein